jgi:hypothetical protein
LPENLTVELATDRCLLEQQILQMALAVSYHR